MSIFRRRRIGPAYEKYPAASIVDYSKRNLMILLGGVLCMVAFWLVCWVGVHLVNFLATFNDADKVRPLYQSHPLVLAFKLFGGVVVFIFVAATRSR